MYIEKKDLEYFVERLKERGMSAHLARKTVDGFYECSMDFLDEKTEVLLPGSDEIYLRKSGNRLKVYPKR